MLQTALQGIRVVALEQAVAGPLCSRHLADLGADVVKVERVDSGEFARHYDSLMNGDSTYFTWLNWGKRSVALDLRTESGIATLRRMVDRCDVLVSNLGPGSTDRLLPDRRERNPRLVHCAISAFGPGGPNTARKGFDMLIQAEAGVIAATGTQDQPAKPGVSLADLSGGIYAATAILAALHERTTSGLGAELTISMFDTVAEWMSPLLVAAKATGHAPPPAGLHHAAIVPYGPYPTSDGQVVVAVQNQDQWMRFCAVVLNQAALATDARFESNRDRLARRAELDALITPTLAAKTTEEVARLLDRADVPWARMSSVEDVVFHRELVERDRWQSVRLSGGGEGDVLVSPFLSGPLTGRRVPAVGEHNHAILTELKALAEIKDESTEDLVERDVVAGGVVS